MFIYPVVHPALQTLKRKKMYEQQRDQMAAQSFNIEQVFPLFHEADMDT